MSLSSSHRAQKKGYEEVHVPAVKHIPVEGETLVPIEDLPKWVQPAFKVQQYLDENKLVCANMSCFLLLICCDIIPGKVMPGTMSSAFFSIVGCSR